MGEKWDHCYSSKFTGISKIEINCVILNAIYWKKVNFDHLQLVYTEIRRKQRMPNNFRAKFFHSFLKQTVIIIVAIVARKFYRSSDLLSVSMKYGVPNVKLAMGQLHLTLK